MFKNLIAYRIAPGWQPDLTALEDALAKNPVRELIEAGMMPTIVEDLDQEDIYSYKSRTQKKVESFTAKINPHVVSWGYPGEK